MLNGKLFTGYLPQNETVSSKSDLIWKNHAFDPYGTGVVDRYEITEEMFNQLEENFRSLDPERNIAFAVATTYNRKPDWNKIKINIQGIDIDPIPLPNSIILLRLKNIFWN